MKEELRKEFVDELRKGITFAGQVGDYVINQSLFDWFYSKLEAKDKEIADMGERYLKDINELRDLNSSYIIEIADLKAKLERMESIKKLIDFQSKYDISMNFQFWGDKGVSVYIEKDGIDLNSFHFDTPEETIDAALKYLKRINKNP